MARTYYAEGRQVANALSVIFVLIVMIMYMLIKFDFLTFIGLIVGSILAANLLGSLWTMKRRAESKSRKRSSSSKRTTVAQASQRTSNQVRSDAEILTSSFDEMNGFEFERLLALYFRDQGYEVREVGVGGNDGGVDLVIIDKRGEKTAVQAKCYSEHNLVPVQIVRELVGAKRNHDCILSLLVTTSDLTPPAKREAEQFKVDYWHGALLEQKLRTWGKWQPSKKKQRQVRKVSTQTEAKREITQSKSQVAAARPVKAVDSSVTCHCGAPMVKRKNKLGIEFWGCSRFPQCRHTRSV